MKDGRGLAAGWWALRPVLAIYSIDLLWLSRRVAVRHLQEGKSKAFPALCGVYTLAAGSTFSSMSSGIFGLTIWLASSLHVVYKCQYLP